ncbi:hypothetical protein [Streptomyces megasporus]|uniref:hypothetical protein n=1 Tax=Streptomyces megasporus TaxID=44060 RepID=UPI0004E1CBF8|nr:hypothetical protein [Streptomyces megasporus]
MESVLRRRKAGPRPASRVAFSLAFLWAILMLAASNTIATGSSWAEVFGQIGVLQWVLYAWLVIGFPLLGADVMSADLIPRERDIRARGRWDRVRCFVLLLGASVLALFVLGVLLGDRPWDARLAGFTGFLASPVFVTLALLYAAYAFLSPVLWPTGARVVRRLARSERRDRALEP